MDGSGRLEALLITSSHHTQQPSPFFDTQTQPPSSPLLQQLPSSSPLRSTYTHTHTQQHLCHKRPLSSCSLIRQPCTDTDTHTHTPHTRNNHITTSHQRFVLSSSSHHHNHTIGEHSYTYTTLSHTHIQHKSMKRSNERGHLSKEEYDEQEGEEGEGGGGSGTFQKADDR